jgi:hypothetical protein
VVTRSIGIGIGAVAARARPAAPAAASSFNVATGGTAAPVQENQPAPAVSIAGMLALQEAEAETIQDKTARRHGLALLDALSALQQALLSPLADGEPEIAALTRLAAEIPETTDPGLSALLAPIRLRAKIELLRRGVQLP